MKLLLAFLLSACTPAFAQNNGQTNAATNNPGISGSKNYVKNPDCAKGVASITASGGSLAKGTTTPLNEDSGSECTIDASSSGQTYTWAFNTFGQNLKGQNCEVRFTYEGDASLYKAYVKNGSTQITSDLTLTYPTYTQTASINFPCGDLSASNTFVIESTSASAAAISVGKVYAGLATNLSNVAQATLYGAINYSGATNCIWTTTSTSMANFSADTDCNTPTVKGNASAPGTKIPGITFSSLPPGEYLVRVEAAFGVATSNETIFARLSDGTNSTQAVQVAKADSTTGSVTNGYQGNFTYTTPQSNITIQLQGATTTGTMYVLANSTAPDSGFTITVYRFPTQSEIALNVRNPAAPTIQTFSSGTNATYTRPQGVKYIRVRMVGGGGGGGGGGTSAGSAAGAGGNTCFGTNATACTSPTLQANGGSAGAFITGGAGGGAGTINSPAYGTTNSGAAGGTYTFQVASTNVAGMSGGASVFGGNGNGAGAGNGAAGTYGSGGGGGGGSTSTYGGGGGGAGAYIEAYIVNPASTYYYTVGSSGTAGGAGGSGFAGGAGGAGYIEVTEYYDSGNAPLLVGSVTNSSTGAMRIEAASLSVGPGAALQSQFGDWISSISTGANGIATINFKSGTWSAAPFCFANNNGTDLSYVVTAKFSSASTSSIVINEEYHSTDGAKGAANEVMWIFCIGPR